MRSLRPGTDCRAHPENHYCFIQMWLRLFCKLPQSGAGELFHDHRLSASSSVPGTEILMDI